MSTRESKTSVLNQIIDVADIGSSQPNIITRSMDTQSDQKNVRISENYILSMDSTAVASPSGMSSLQSSTATPQQSLQSVEGAPVLINSTSVDLIHATSTVSQSNPTATASQAPVTTLSVTTQMQNVHQNNRVDNIIVPVADSVFNTLAPRISGSNHTHVSSEDENVLKYFIMLRPTGPAAKVLAKVSKDLYLGGLESVKDYCINTLHLSNADYRKLFTGLERQMLEAGTSWDTLDITFLYKMLQRVCGLAPSADKKWANPNPQDISGTEHNLYLIKCERNFLAHEAVVLSDVELEQRSQRLKTLLTNVLQDTGLRRNTDYSQDIATMKFSIDEIVKTSTRLSLQEYQKVLEELRSQIVNKVVIESQSELREYYLDLWSSTLVTWAQNQMIGSIEGLPVPKIEQVFTNITIKDGNGDEICLNDLFTQCLPCGSLPRLLIIEGIAGIGKSYICKFILHKWASKTPFEVGLHDVDIVIFIRCHSVNSESLREFLCEELLPLTCNNLRHEDIIPAFRKCNVMFIIDGIDEAGARAKGIIKEVAKKFPSSRILITCRPEFTEVTKLLLIERKSFSVFYAKGFSDSQRKEYLGKLLSTLQNNEIGRDMKEDLYNKIKELELHLVSLLSLPLTVMMVVTLLLEDAGSLSVSTTATHIYQQTIDIRIKQVAERIHRKPMESRHISLIERLCYQWFKVLCEVAWETLMMNTLILDEKSTSALIDKAVEHGIDPMDVMSSFLRCQILGNKYVWEFFHKAFQEYLSASHLSSNSTDGITEIDKKINNERKISTTSIYSVIYYRQNCLSSLFKCLHALCQCKTSSTMERGISCNAPNEINLMFGEKRPRARYLKGESLAFTTDNITSSRSSSRSRSPNRSRSASPDRLSKYNSYRIGHLVAPEENENPYEIEGSFDDIAQINAALQNMLQFWGAIEAGKPEVDHYKMKNIVEKFRQSIVTDKWGKWAIFVRECHENPLVCQFVRSYLDGNNIDAWLLGQKSYDHLEAVEYLLKKTHFVPKDIVLCFYDDHIFPKNLKSLLSTFTEILPTTVSELKCIPKHSKALHNSLAPLESIDFIDLTIRGTVKEEQKEDFVGLITFLNSRNADVKLEAVIAGTNDLIILAQCCISAGLPKRTQLQLIVSSISDEMLNSLCQILKTLSWIKPFSFVFSHTDLSEKTAMIQNHLIKALQQDNIQLKEVELVVDAYAESTIDFYETMAQNIAGDIPVALTFNDWSDADDVRLVFRGERES